METTIQDPFIKLTETIIAYLPNLLAGILLVLLGWLAGWIVKRVVVQFFIILRVDRFFKRFAMKADFSKADVRYSAANFLGNICYAIVFFIFLDNALVAWKLNELSEMLSKGILFLPKIILALIIFGIGWFVASWVQVATLRSLHREKVPKASLIAKFIKSLVLLFFSAIAFVELDVAREIVIIGFAGIFITLCIISIIMTTIGAKDFIKKIEETFRE